MIFSPAMICEALCEKADCGHGGGMAETVTERELVLRGMAPAVAAALGEHAHLVREVRAFAQSCRSAAEAASLLAVPPQQVVKSLVFMRHRDDAQEEPLLLLAPGHRRVDETRLAARLAAPVRPARAREVKAITGFEIGAVPPIGHVQRLAGFIDAMLLAQDVIWASAGTVRAMMALSPRDLLALTGAQPVDLG